MAKGTHPLVPVTNYAARPVPRSVGTGFSLTIAAALNRSIHPGSNLSLLKITQGSTHTTSQQRKLL